MTKAVGFGREVLDAEDVYHGGELSQTLGVAGLPQIDLWG